VGGWGEKSPCRMWKHSGVLGQKYGQKREDESGLQKIPTASFKRATKEGTNENKHVTTRKKSPSKEVPHVSGVDRRVQCTL